MELSPPELSRRVNLAATGDGVAARQVWIHYATVEDEPQYQAWLRKAAELSDCNSLQHWAETVRLSEDADAATAKRIAALSTKYSCRIDG